jgi:hypothetical protein
MENLKKIMTSKERLFRHVALPLIPPGALICLYFTPKAVCGCANRGLMALSIVFIAMIAAAVTTKKGIDKKKRGENGEANWWFATTLILLSPFLLLFGPLG